MTVGTGYAHRDGVRLYYEVAGAGPALLVVQGGSSDAGATAGLVGALAATHRVITYDRRGIARSSTVDEPVTMATHAADAAAVIAAAAPDGHARVVGTSIGALVGLHLLLADPERVDRLVAHEPPMTAVLRESDRERAHDEVAELARREGPVPAIRRMATVIGLDPGSIVFEEGATPPTPSPTPIDDLRTFFAHDFPAVRASTLVPSDLDDAVRAVLVPAGGLASRGAWEQRCATALAQACGRELLELPGAHNGLITHPRGAAEVLRTVL